MVTKERKLVSIEVVNSLLEKHRVEERYKVVDELKKLPVRQPAPAPPEGGISIRAAARKYGVPDPTISRWAARGLIRVLLRTKNEVYLSEDDLIPVIKRYKQAPGRGRRTVSATELDCSTTQ